MADAATLALALEFPPPSSRTGSHASPPLPRTSFISRACSPASRSAFPRLAPHSALRTSLLPLNPSLPAHAAPSDGSSRTPDPSSLRDPAPSPAPPPPRPLSSPRASPSFRSFPSRLSHSPLIRSSPLRLLHAAAARERRHSRSHAHAQVGALPSSAASEEMAPKKRGDGATDAAPPPEKRRKESGKGGAPTPTADPAAATSARPGPRGEKWIQSLAATHWPADGSGSFDGALLSSIYDEFLREPHGGTRAAADPLLALELSGYLERYLLPHLDPSAASWQHLMSLVVLANLKFREGVSAWPAFAAHADKFAALFTRVLELPAEAPAMSFDERSQWTQFLIHAFQSLENDMVRPQVLRLVSLPMWFTISPKLLSRLLSENPQLQQPWKFLQKRRKKEAKLDEVPISSRHEREFIPGLLATFLETLEAWGTDADESAPGAASSPRSRYLERTLELIIDLLAQLPTRRFFHAVLLDCHLLERATLSAFCAEGGRQAALFNQLLKMVDFYDKFEIDDQRGTPISDAEVKAIRCSQLQALQRAAFKMEGLQEFALSNLSAVDSKNALTTHFSRLEPAQIAQIGEALGLLHSSEQGEALGKRFLVQLLVNRFERRTPQHETMGQLPLYPDEKMPWDPAVVPEADFRGDTCLALPKLNLQFLTLNDYLMRNFNLFRLEATYEIKEDIQDAVQRLQPRRQLTGATSFRGWARMALPVQEFKIFKVAKPFLGEARPSEVRAECSVSLAGTRFEVASEWDQLRRHDVVFLLTLEAPAESAAENSEAPWPERFGLRCVRGAEVVQVVDGEGHVFTGESENDQPLKGQQRKVELLLDAAQYHIDAQMMAEGKSSDVYQTFNVLLRRKAKENNFKAILDSIRALMTTPLVVPEWLQDVLLGYGDPSGAAYWNLPLEERVTSFDFFDTFLDVAHVAEAFPQAEVRLAENFPPHDIPPPPYRLTIPAETPRASSTLDSAESAKPVIVVEPYKALVAGPYPEDMPRMNSVRFTPMQVEALRSAMNPGLTVVVGPPGTGKTDTAVQIMSNIHHTFPDQRTLIITHSNQALNDVFEKLLVRDIDERYMLRLGHGEELLETEKDFSRLGRVNHMLKRRLELLVRVETLGKTLDLTADVGYTCETAQYFYLSAVLARWEQFEEAAKKRQAEGAQVVSLLFPFTDFFADAPQPLFRGEDFAADMEKALGCFRHLQRIFEELEECRAFELLRSSYDRGNYLLTKHAKIIAMTCTHAAIKRRDLIALNFQYDNLIMEEAAQIMEIETFIPMVLQNPDAATGRSRLKRVVLIGDHHQLPPVVKNLAFQKYSKLDQSLFARFVRLGVPAVQLDKQGRARKAIADLYRWRYTNLGDLPSVATEDRFKKAVPGFVHAFQLIDVGDLQGVGESSPLPYYIQNLAEAEYVVATFMYMRLQGIPASRISIITTYNGQKDLIQDVIAQRCSYSPLFGSPAKIATTDKFQGQQNDYILLSLVRTKSVGHIRDVRRLVVSMSRSRLGLYVFCRRALFENCVELRNTFSQLLADKPDKLELLPAERAPTDRNLGEVPAQGVVTVEDVVQMGELVASMAQSAESDAEQMDDRERYSAEAYYEAPEAPPDELPDAPPDDE